MVRSQHGAIDQLKELHPELASWGLLAIGCAWGAYSQDIMAVGWLCPALSGSERTLDFLAYCYVRQLAPAFNFGGTGLYSEGIFQLGRLEPWLGAEHPAPAWAVK